MKNHLLESKVRGIVKNWKRSRGKRVRDAYRK